MLQFIYESFSLFIALSAGIYAYRYMSSFARTLFFQLLVWIFFYLVSYLITLYQIQSQLVQNNQWIFNIYIILETLLLSIASYRYLQDAGSKYLAFTLYGLFLLVMLAQLSMAGYSGFANYGVAIAGILVTILYTLILYRQFTVDTSSKIRTPEIWAGIGLVIYFACDVPYFSLFSYLNTYHLKLSSFLFHVITDVLANIRYLLLAVTFWLIGRKAVTAKIKGS